MLNRLKYIILFLFLAPFSYYSQSEAEENILKAAFIYNFTKYFEWDASISETEFIIGVIGHSQIFWPLAEIARTKTVNDKKITIRKFNTPDEIIFSHILFISNDASFPLNEILAKASVKGTLIVSEKTGFASQGTAINFIVINNNLKFEANTKAIDLAGLKASSQLLKLAILIEQP